MKAVLSKEVGGPDTLVVEDLDSPTPDQGEVLIEVAACAINFPDSLIIKDMYQMKPPRPFSPGERELPRVGGGITSGARRSHSDSSCGEGGRMAASRRPAWTPAGKARAPLKLE